VATWSADTDSPQSLPGTWSPATSCAVSTGLACTPSAGALGKVLLKCWGHLFGWWAWCGMFSDSDNLDSSHSNSLPWNNVFDFVYPVLGDSCAFKFCS
jgi:hypothetical protein